MLPQKIVNFIRRHHVMTLCTCAGNVPHCCNLFYVYMERENMFVFTTDHHTMHAVQALANPLVAASIVLETKVVGRVQGLQMHGRVWLLDAEPEEGARKAYLSRYPYAALHELTLWAFEPGSVKMTDNTLGFGKKLIWTKDEK